MGASGVFVNLFALAAFTGMGLISSLASAVAIEVSVLSNFFMNEYWTFREGQRDTGLGTRFIRFQMVSLLGAGIQWCVFIVGNTIFYAVLNGSAALGDYFAGANGTVEMLLRPIVNPPEVGYWLYVSQLAGIGVATGWNFLANFYWTWRSNESSVE